MSIRSVAEGTVSVLYGLACGVIAVSLCGLLLLGFEVAESAMETTWDYALYTVMAGVVALQYGIEDWRKKAAKRNHTGTTTGDEAAQ